MSKKSPLWDNPTFIEDCLTRPKKDVMHDWGVSSGLVVDVKKEHGGGIDAARAANQAKVQSFESDQDGNQKITKIADRIIPLDEWLEDLRKRGFAPDDFTYSVGHSIYEQHTKAGVTKTLYANKFSATKRTKKGGGDNYTKGDHQAFLEAVRTFTYQPRPRDYAPESLVLLATDFQAGKVDINGSSADTIAQVLNSFARAAEFAKANPVQEICIVDAGDIVENVWSTSSQLGTNDLDLPHQIVEAAYLMQRGIQMLAPLAPKIRYAAVSSNHGQHRMGLKAPAGDAHADFGLAVAKMLAHGFELNPSAYGHVTFQTPEPFMESLAFDTSGTRIGVVHGHQVNSADKIGEWWKGQSHGRMPTADADILLTGHWHSLRVQQSGDARWIFVGPSSDRGSSWFTNLKGDQSESGMLMFTTRDQQWSNLAVV